MTNNPKKLILLACLLCACDTTTPEQRRVESLRRLDFMERQIHADLLREKAECQAVAIENPDRPDWYGTCLDGLSAMHHNALTQMQNIDTAKQRLTAGGME